MSIGFRETGASLSNSKNSIRTSRSITLNELDMDVFLIHARPRYAMFDTTRMGALYMNDWRKAICEAMSGVRYDRGWRGGYDMFSPLGFDGLIEPLNELGKGF